MHQSTQIQAQILGEIVESSFSPDSIELMAFLHPLGGTMLFLIVLFYFIGSLFLLLPCVMT